HHEHYAILLRRGRRARCARDLRFRAQDQHWLISEPQIESTKFNIFQHRRCLLCPCPAATCTLLGRGGMRQNLILSQRRRISSNFLSSRGQHLIAPFLLLPRFPEKFVRLRIGPSGIGNRRHHSERRAIARSRSRPSLILSWGLRDGVIPVRRRRTRWLPAPQRRPIVVFRRFT